MRAQTRMRVAGALRVGRRCPIAVGTSLFSRELVSPALSLTFPCPVLIPPVSKVPPVGSSRIAPNGKERRPPLKGSLPSQPRKEFNTPCPLYSTTQSVFDSDRFLYVERYKCIAATRTSMAFPTHAMENYLFGEVYGRLYDYVLTGALPAAALQMEY